MRRKVYGNIFLSQNKQIITYFKIEAANPVKNSNNYDDLFKVKSIQSNVNCLSQNAKKTKQPHFSVLRL